MEISKTTQTEQRIVKPLFSFGDWTWPLMVAVAVVCLLAVDGRILIEKQDGFSFSLGSGPVTGLYLLALITVMIIKRMHLVRRHRVWLQAIRGKSQFLCFSDKGIRYGYEDVQDNFLAWTAISSAMWTSRGLDLQLGNQVIAIALTDFSDEERNRLKSFLESRQLVKDGEQPPASE